jgi:hypothetical protein
MISPPRLDRVESCYASSRLEISDTCCEDRVRDGPALVGGGAPRVLILYGVFRCRWTTGREQGEQLRFAGRQVLIKS